jgi:putative ABC transport system ATP-binding protein
MSAALSFRGVRKTFLPGTANEVTALDGIDFDIAAGDFVTVIGSNGAGKSTFAKVISGLVVPDSGAILVDGRDVTREPVWERAAEVGRIAQDPNDSTCAGMTIEENLAMAERRGRSRGLQRAVTQAARERFREALAPVGLNLETRLEARVGTLSGGQRQALALLMATLSGSRILLLDEHLAALDPKTAEAVMTLTARLVTERRLTTVMITHRMHDAIRWGNRLLMMDSGRIIFEARDAEKSGLTVPMLVEKFTAAGRGEFDDDETLLSASPR